LLFFNESIQNKYREKDSLLELLTTTTNENDGVFTSHKWLLESLPKRMIYFYMYEELISGSGKIRTVLDIGGGYTSLTRLMMQNCSYTLLDIMAHDSHELLNVTQKSLNQNFWVNSDWYEFQPDTLYDLVIANDLFPNVDQRLELFLQKFIPICRELRLSLTYYNTPRWYKVKRMDGDEVFHMMAWNGTQIQNILEKYIDRIQKPQLNLLLQNPTSLFANNRQVCLVSLRGR
jgi:hypothetical protein